MAVDKKNSSSSLPAWKWAGTETLGFVFALNERTLEVLGSKSAANDRRLPERADIALVRECEGEWLALDERSRKRAAQCPFLLLEIPIETLKPSRELRDPSIGEAKETPLSPFPAEVAREFAAEALTVAWHAARLDPRVAALTFGLPLSGAALIAALTPRELQRATLRAAHNLRPRWAEDAEFWRMLLRTATQGDPQLLTQFRLRSLQLLGHGLLNAN